MADTQTDPITERGDNSRTCLVTGAQGFLGRQVAAEFRAAGYRVVGIAREPLDESLPLDAYICSELPGPALGDLLAAEQPDVVVHTAGPASVMASMQDPVADLQGTVMVLAAVLHDIRKFSPSSRLLVLSSAAVYGNPLTLPVSEGARLAPVSPYGFHKMAAETLLSEFFTVFGIRAAALRIFSAYGPGLRRQLLFDICEKARAGGVVRLFGTGNETRDFVHGKDVARACRVVAENAPMHAEAYNCASGHETTVRKIAEMLVPRIAPGDAIEFSGEERAGDPLRWSADISRLSALGFTPAVSIEDGVADYAEWYLGQVQQ